MGKSTVGRELARRLEYTFLDTDQIVCQRKGTSIDTIVREEGWKVFRSMENEVLKELTGIHECIVATGGGAILHRDTWLRIRDTSLVVWLSAPVEVLKDRLSKDPGNDENRPSLTGREISDEFADVLAEREPLYREMAHVVIAAGSLDIFEIVDRIQVEHAQRSGREKY